MRAIIGLGNPGAEYAQTRHNIGWRVVEELGRVLGVESWKAKFNAEIAKAGSRLLVKPTTYMNHSGQAVQQVARFYKLKPDQLVIIGDDIDLPFGEVRWRDKGSSGGQKGLANVLEILGTEGVPRLRIGIGRPDRGEVTDYVLGQFTEAERQQLPNIIEDAVKLLQEKTDE